MADREMMKDANTDLQSESSAKTCANYNYLQAISVYDEGPKVGNYAGVCRVCGIDYISQVVDPDPFGSESFHRFWFLHGVIHPHPGESIYV